MTFPQNSQGQSAFYLHVTQCVKNDYNATCGIETNLKTSVAFSCAHGNRDDINIWYL